MKIKVAAVQTHPVFFNKDQTLEKVQRLVSQQAKDGCQLIVFPESFIPGYPRGFDFGTKVGSRSIEGKKLYAKYYSESIDLESDDLKIMEGIAKENNVYLVLGVTEKNKTHKSLYCSTLYISPTKGLLGVHRKIKPTGSERLFWAEADGSSLTAVSTKIGKLSGLICWENYMPLARMAVYQTGVEIYIAPTADSRTDWTSTMKHIALEGRCFVIGCNQYFRSEFYPEEYQKYAVDSPDNFCEGGSVIISPMGEVLAGPLFGESGVLTAELDLEEITQSKFDFDVIGHYSRPDIFSFHVKDQPDIIEE